MENSLVGSSSSPSCLSHNCHLNIGVEHWLVAEDTINEILSAVQPSVISYKKRYAIVNYIWRLIRGLVGDKVMVYGSMPLKTYLPDGDIDVSVFCSEDNVESLASSIRATLTEQKSVGSSITDIAFVDAKLVKIVKCLVQHVPVDISFNQFSGLKSYCFLEQIDRHIGRDHLFKRSIILIKAWCLYESRVLGSRYGLLGTYALDILVLYIINVFHPSLAGPFAVLHKFLGYYSTFDWDRFCITLNGPVDLNSLPALIVETSAIRDNDLLLCEGLLESCIRSSSVPAEVCQTETKEFKRKHMNIVDPLNVNNNLGFSVGQGSFYRIKLAFADGCQQLRACLQQPAARIGNGIMRLFTNTTGAGLRRTMLEGEVTELSNLTGCYYGPIESLCYSIPPPPLSSKGKSELRASAPSFLSSRAKATGESSSKRQWSENQRGPAQRVLMVNQQVNTRARDELKPLPSCENPSESSKDSGSGCFSLSSEEFPPLSGCSKVNGAQLSTDSWGRSTPESGTGVGSGSLLLTLKEFPPLPSCKEATMSRAGWRRKKGGSPSAK